MSDSVIRVEKLSKKYVLSHQQKGQSSYKSLREVISNKAQLLGKKLLKPSGKEIYNPSIEEFWALKDVSFEINQGDRVGIIGRNGAGKSTLLKILSRITEPTNGRIKINGRVASLLEVGTGFHPELTGRENIFLNGAILGMSKVEIQRKFDEIVDFAEVEKFLDTPVKRYSSGMYVRLAFAVAAHLDPEILIVDEVLAVGDVQFQKKCLGKMQDVSKDQGRTVLFVSHNMDAIQRLCSQCVMLERGRVTAQGDTDSIVTRYMSNNSTIESSPNQWIDLSDVRRTGNGKARFVGVKYSSLNQEVAFQPYSYGPLEFSLAIESNSSQSIGSLAVNISNQTGTLLINADTVSRGQTTFLRNGRNIVKFRLNDLYLKEGIYIVGLWLEKTGTGHEILDYLELAFEIEIVNLGDETFGVKTPGLVPCQFSLLEVT